MKKIISKNPLKAKKIALLILIFTFGACLVVSLLSRFSLVGWIGVLSTSFAISIFSCAAKIEIEQTSKKLEEFKEKFKGLSFPNVTQEDITLNEEEN